MFIDIVGWVSLILSHFVITTTVVRLRAVPLSGHNLRQVLHECVKNLPKVCYLQAEWLESNRDRLSRESNVTTQYKLVPVMMPWLGR